jgi:hypothetical protein
MVAFLLDKGAEIAARNEGASRVSTHHSQRKVSSYSWYAGTGWTALHAAAFQEHGKVVRILLDRGANPRAKDVEGRAPVDYASISEAIWPFFAGNLRSWCPHKMHLRIVTLSLSLSWCLQPRAAAKAARRSWWPRVLSGRSSINPSRPRLPTSAWTQYGTSPSLDRLRTPSWKANRVSLQLSDFSRPGSAYTRAQFQPPSALRQAGAFVVGKVMRP